MTQNLLVLYEHICQSQLDYKSRRINYKSRKLKQLSRLFNDWNQLWFNRTLDILARTTDSRTNLNWLNIQCGPKKQNPRSAHYKLTSYNITEVHKKSVAYTRSHWQENCCQPKYTFLPRLQTKLSLNDLRWALLLNNQQQRNKIAIPVN